jgi:hypothetical protein
MKKLSIKNMTASAKGTVVSPAENPNKELG